MGFGFWLGFTGGSLVLTGIVHGPSTLVVAGIGIILVGFAAP